MSPALKAVAASAVLIVVILAAFVLSTLEREELPPPPSEVGDAPATEHPERAAVEVAETGREVTTVVQRDAVVVTARVSDRAGRALARASFRVFRAADGNRNGPMVWDSSAPENQSQRSVFSLRLEPGAYFALAQCAGHAGEKRPVTIVKGQPQELVFELGRGSAISGRILDTSGAGVGGARVVALKEFAAPDADIEELLKGLIDLEEMTNEVAAETVSAEDGSYQLDGLDTFWFAVRAVAPGFAPNQVDDVPAPRERVDVVLSAGGIVTGVVRDNRGRVVPGVEISAYRETSSRAMLDVILDKARPPVDVVLSNDSGQFEFGTLGSGVFNFRAIASGYRPLTKAKVQVTPGTTVDFELEQGLVIAGYIQGPNGEPVVGARVRAQQTGRASRGPPQIDIISFGKGEVSTNVEGAFLFDTLESGEYMLFAFHEDYQTLRRQGVRPESGELELRMSFGGRLRGLVTDEDGQVIAGARVVASDVADFTRSELTGENGVFVLFGLQTGGRRKVTVSVRADGYASSRRDIEAKQDREVEAEFRLVPTSTIRGVVVTSNGDPMRGVMLMVKKSREDTAVDYTLASGRTDSQGSYEISNVEAGDSLWIRAKLAGFLEGISDVFTLEPSEVVEVPTIVLDLGGTLTGTVVDPDGKPVARALVTIRNEGQSEAAIGVNPSRTTHEGGEFRLAGLPSGRVDLIVKTTEFLDAVVPDIDVIEGQVAGPVSVQLELGSVIAGRVINPAGTGIAGAEVMVRDYSRGAQEYRGVTDANGNFEVRKIQTAGEVEVEVTHSDHADYLREDVGVGDALEITLRELGRVVGTVVGPDGAPVTTFSVQPQIVGSVPGRKKLRSRTMNADDGHFEYAGIPDGVYTIQVRNPAYSASSIADVEVREGEEVDLGHIELRAGGVVSGKVVDAVTREPVFGARVTIVQGASRFLRGVGAAPSGPARRPIQTTDSNGEFSFAGLKGGSLTLKIKHADFVETTVAANPDSEADSRGLAIELSRGGEITGVVLGPGGRPRANMRVYLIGAGPSANQSSRSDKEGKFKFRRVVPGAYTVKAHQFAQGPDRPVQQAELELEIDSGQRQDVVLQLP